MKAFFFIGLAVVAALVGGFLVANSKKASDPAIPVSEARINLLANVLPALANINKGKYPNQKFIIASLEKENVRAKSGRIDSKKQELKNNPGTTIIFLSRGKRLEVGYLEEGESTGYYLVLQGANKTISKIEIG